MDKVHYGTETAKALIYFNGENTPYELIKPYGEVKKAVIMAQQECFALYDQDLYAALIESVDEIIEGKHNDQFPLPLKQGGAGTSLHMNMNEVICSLTHKNKEKYSVHPLEDLARFQSTNDTLSTAVTIMVYRQLVDIEARIIELQEILVSKEMIYADILMTGRTELQDALPVTLGQVFGSWAGCIERDRWRLNKLKERLRNISLGGTAMGTCFSAPRKYVHCAEKNLRSITGLPLCRSQNLPDEISNKDTLAEISNGFSLIALNLKKISNDLLLYTSSLSGELIHSECQYGSTIMPYKSNPVLLEYIKGLAISIKHKNAEINDFASEGQLQLNPFLPFIAEAFISAAAMLCNALTTMNKVCSEIISPDLHKINENLLKSPALINTLLPVIGYDRLKKIIPIIRKSHCKNLKELILLISKESELSIEFLDQWLKPDKLTSFSDFYKEKIE